MVELIQVPTVAAIVLIRSHMPAILSRATEQLISWQEAA